MDDDPFAFDVNEGAAEPPPNPLEERILASHSKSRAKRVPSSQQRRAVSATKSSSAAERAKSGSVGHDQDHSTGKKAKRSTLGSPTAAQPSSTVATPSAAAKRTANTKVNAATTKRGVSAKPGATSKDSRAVGQRGAGPKRSASYAAATATAVITVVDKESDDDGGKGRSDVAIPKRIRLVKRRPAAARAAAVITVDDSDDEDERELTCVPAKKKAALDERVAETNVSNGTAARARKHSATPVSTGRGTSSAVISTSPAKALSRQTGQEQTHSGRNKEGPVPAKKARQVQAKANPRSSNGRRAVPRTTSRSDRATGASGSQAAAAQHNVGAGPATASPACDKTPEELSKDIVACVNLLSPRVEQDGKKRKRVEDALEQLHKLLGQLTVSPLSMAFVGTQGMGKSKTINKILFPEGEGLTPLPQGMGARGVTQVITIIRPKKVAAFTLELVECNTLDRSRLDKYLRRQNSNPFTSTDLTGTQEEMKAALAEKVAVIRSMALEVTLSEEGSYACADEMSCAMAALGAEIKEIHAAAYAPMIDHMVLEGPFRHASADVQLCDMPGTNDLPAKDKKAANILRKAHAIFITTGRLVADTDLAVLENHDFGLTSVNYSDAPAKPDSVDPERNMVLINALNDDASDNNADVRLNLLNNLRFNLDKYCGVQFAIDDTQCIQRGQCLDGLRASTRVFLVNTDSSPERFGPFVDDVRRLLTHKVVATFLQMAKTSLGLLKCLLKAKPTAIIPKKRAIKQRIKTMRERATEEYEKPGSLAELRHKLRTEVHRRVLSHVMSHGDEVADLRSVLLAAADDEVQKFIATALQRASDNISQDYKPHSADKASVSAPASAAGNPASTGGAADAETLIEEMRELVLVHTENVVKEGWRNLRISQRSKGADIQTTLVPGLKRHFHNLSGPEASSLDDTLRIKTAARHLLVQVSHHSSDEDGSVAYSSPSSSAHNNGVLKALNMLLDAPLKELENGITKMIYKLIGDVGCYFRDLLCSGLDEPELSPETSKDLQLLQQYIKELREQNVQYDEEQKATEGVSSMTTLAFPFLPLPDAQQVLCEAARPAKTPKTREEAPAASPSKRKTPKSKQSVAPAAPDAGGAAAATTTTPAGEGDADTAVAARVPDNLRLADFSQKQRYTVEYNAPPEAEDVEEVDHSNPPLPTVVVAFPPERDNRTIQFTPNAAAQSLLGVFGEEVRDAAAATRRGVPDNKGGRQKCVAPATFVAIDSEQLPPDYTLPNVLEGEEPNTGQQTLAHLTVLVVPVELGEVACKCLRQLTHVQRSSGESLDRVLLVLLPAGTTNAALGFEVAQAFYSQQEYDYWWAFPLNFRSFYEYRRYTLRARCCTSAFAMTYVQEILATLERQATVKWREHLQSKENNFYANLGDLDATSRELICELIFKDKQQTKSLFQIANQLLASEECCNPKNPKTARMFEPLCNLLRICGIYMPSFAFFGHGHNQRGVLDYKIYRGSHGAKQRKFPAPMLVCSVSSRVFPFPRDFNRRGGLDKLAKTPTGRAVGNSPPVPEDGTDGPANGTAGAGAAAGAVAAAGGAAAATAETPKARKNDDSDPDNVLLKRMERVYNSLSRSSWRAFICTYMVAFARREK